MVCVALNVINFSLSIERRLNLPEIDDLSAVHF